MNTYVIYSAVSTGYISKASCFNLDAVLSLKSWALPKSAQWIAADSEIIFCYLIRLSPVVFLRQIPFAILCSRLSMARTAISLSTLTERTREITSAYLPDVTLCIYPEELYLRKRSISTPAKVFKVHWTNRCYIKLF